MSISVGNARASRESAAKIKVWKEVSEFQHSVGLIWTEAICERDKQGTLK